MSSFPLRQDNFCESPKRPQAALAMDKQPENWIVRHTRAIEEVQPEASSVDIQRDIVYGQTSRTKCEICTLEDMTTDDGKNDGRKNIVLQCRSGIGRDIFI